jgi:hypothetical protein
VETIAPASATEGSDVVFNFTLSNFAIDVDYTFLYWLMELQVT